MIHPYYKDAPQYLKDVQALAKERGLEEVEVLPDNETVRLVNEDLTPTELVDAIASSGSPGYTLNLETDSLFSTNVALTWLQQDTLFLYFFKDSEYDVKDSLHQAIIEDSRVKHWVAFPREKRLHFMKDVVNEYIENSEQVYGVGKLLLNDEQKDFLQQLVLSHAERAVEYNWKESYNQAIGNPELLVNTVNYFMGERTHELKSILRTWFQVYSRGYFPTEDMLETMVTVYNEHNK